MPDLQACCRLTERMIAMEDPGNCPATWTRQLNDNRFYFDDSQVRYLGSGWSQGLERSFFRVCLRNRITQQWPPFHLNYKEKSNYLSSCCWHIAIWKRSNTIIYPNSNNWSSWVSDGITFIVLFEKEHAYKNLNSMNSK